MERRDLEVLAVEEDQIGVLQRGQRDAVVNPPVSLRRPPADDRTYRQGGGARPGDEQPARRRGRNRSISAGGRFRAR